MRKDRFVLIILIVLIIGVAFYLYLPQEKSIIFNNNSPSLEIKKGSSIKIDYELNKNLNITWISDNLNVASVNNGIVTGNSLGTTTITGIIKYNNKELNIKTIVVVYDGEIGVGISKINLPTNDLIIKKGTEYILPITFVPVNSYISSISYIADNNNVSINGNKIQALETGECNIRVTVNNSVSENIHVIITNENIDTRFINPLKNVVLNTDNYELEVGKEDRIEYSIEPAGADIYSVKWDVEDDTIVNLNNGKILGLRDGETTITLTINDKFINKIKVKVVTGITDIIINSPTILNMKINDTSQINTTVVPDSSFNKKLVYKSDNNNVTVTNSGLIRAINSGKSIITISSPDGSVNKTITVNVLPRTGVIDGTGIWAYSDSKTVTPIRADANFFTDLAKKGIGTISNNVYTYSNYSYDISKSRLSNNGTNAMVRIYYPQGVDLSNVNTFTFLGGSGERNWGSYFAVINKDSSTIKSSGIIILISGDENYRAKDAILGTEFVKAIVKQKNGMRNSIAGYSLGGPAAGDAFNESNYDALFIINSYINGVNTKNIKDKEIYIYSPKGDSMSSKTKTMLTSMANNNYTNVTVVTNNDDLINNYKDRMLIVNPGTLQGSGHGYVNITNSNIFAFACR